MNSWKKIILGTLTTILFLSGIIIFLIGTTTGLHLLLSVVNRWIPGLEIDQLTGSWHNLYLQNIRYEKPGISIKAKELHLKVELNHLYNNGLFIDNLSLKDINISVNSKLILKSDQENKINNSLNFSVPYPIIFSSITINNLNFKIEDITISIMNLSSGFLWREKNLTLTPTLLQGLMIEIPKTTDVIQKKVIRSIINNLQLKGKLLHSTLNNLFSKPVLQKIINIHLPLNINIEEFKGEQLRLNSDIDFVIYNILFKINNVDSCIKIDNLDINSNYGTFNTVGTAKLCEDWPIDIILNSTLNIGSLNNEKVKLKISGELRNKLNIEADFSGSVNMVLHAQTNLAEVGGLPLNLEMASKGLYWPFIGEKQLQAEKLKLKITGRMNNYILSFHTVIKIQGIPTASIILYARGNERKINFDKFIITVLDGKTQFTIPLDRQQYVNWYSELKSKSTNTIKEISYCPSKLNVLVRTRDILHNDGNWQIEIPKLKIAGSVKENKLNIEGSIRNNGYMQWIIPELHITLGCNSANLKGELGVKKLNFDCIIDAPFLSKIIPGLSGIIKGLIKIHGTMDSPQLLINIIASNLRWRELSIAKIWIDGDMKFTNQTSGHLDINIERIVKPGINISLVMLNVKGNEQQHNLQFHIHGEQISGQLHLVGSFDYQTEHWKGILDNTHFTTSVGLLVLNRKIVMDYYRPEQKISISQHCWDNPNFKICIPHIINFKTEGHAVVNLNRLDLVTLKSFMPDNIQHANGIFNGKINIFWNLSSKKRLIQGTIILSGYNIKIVQRINNTSFVITFNTLNLNAQLRNNQAKVKWVTSLANNGWFNGQLQIIDPQGSRNLNGNINIFNFNLVTANAVFSHEESIYGTLNANLQLLGNAKNPQIFGQMKFNCTNIDGNLISFDIQPSQLVMNFNGFNSTASGTIYTKHGEINLNGNINWSKLNNWHVRVTINGNRVRITAPPIIHLDISPDIVFEIMPDLFVIKGRINIPWARIMVCKVPESSVTVSNDEILLNENLKPVGIRSNSTLINSNIIVHMGDDVYIDTFGIKAKLVGDLKVVQDERGLSFNGQINIPEGGQFRIYGQDLIIRKGTLLLYGPFDQLMLNIEAIRDPKSTENNVIVGVRIIASINDLRAEIFSNQEMSQQEILSYLLCGQRLGGKQGDGAAITSTLIGLGIAQSSQFISKIGEVFGINNLTLNTQGVGNSSRVVISGYILPSLQIEYGVGIFNSLSIFTLRYYLMPKLYLEVISGINQALDLLYQFEF